MIKSDSLLNINTGLLHKHLFKKLASSYEDFVYSVYNTLNIIQPSRNSKKSKDRDYYAVSITDLQTKESDNKVDKYFFNKDTEKIIIYKNGEYEKTNSDVAIHINMYGFSPTRIVTADIRSLLSMRVEFVAGEIIIHINADKYSEYYR